MLTKFLAWPIKNKMAMSKFEIIKKDTHKDNLLTSFTETGQFGKKIFNESRT